MKNKQFQGSKKAARKKAYLQRQLKKEKLSVLKREAEQGSIEAEAALLGLKLK